MVFLQKIWGSPTAVTLLGKFSTPLKFLLLTPLVVTKLSDLEFEAYLLFVSVSFLGNMMTPVFLDVFTKMLAFAFAGRDDLSPFSGLRAAKRENIEPNWQAFRECYRSLRYLLLGSGLLMGLVTAGLAYAVVRSLVPEGDAETGLIIAAVLVCAQNFISVVLGGSQCSLKAVDSVVVVARVAVVSSFASTILASLVLLMNWGIAGLFLVIFVISLAGLLYLRVRARRQLGDSVAGKPRWDAGMFRWAWPALWRGFVGNFSVQGVQRIVNVTLASLLVRPGLGAFLFAVMLLTQLAGTLESIVNARIPHFVHLASRHDHKALGTQMGGRMFLAIACYGLAIIVLGLLCPWLFELLGKGDRFPSQEVWWILALSAAGMFVLKQFEKLENLGNTKRFWLNRLIGGVLVLIVFTWLRPSQARDAALAYYLPMILALNVAPVVFALRRLDQGLGEFLRGGFRGAVTEMGGLRRFVS